MAKLGTAAAVVEVAEPAAAVAAVVDGAGSEEAEASVVEAGVAAGVTGGGGGRGGVPGRTGLPPTCKGHDGGKELASNLAEPCRGGRERCSCRGKDGAGSPWRPCQGGGGGQR